MQLNTYAGFLRAGLVGVAFVAGLAISGVPAVASTISGSINIGGTVNDPTDTAGVDFVGTGLTIGGGTGDLSGIANGTTVALTDIVFASLPGTVWSVSGFTFELTSLIGAVVGNTSGGIDFTGVGTLSAAGFDDTSGKFVFTSNSSEGSASFSSTTAVPLPPALLLFGSGIVGLGFLARQRRRRAAPSTGAPSTV